MLGNTDLANPRKILFNEEQVISQITMKSHFLQYPTGVTKGTERE